MINKENSAVTVGIQIPPPIITKAGLPQKLREQMISQPIIQPKRRRDLRS
jgi:hypothetical protein